MSTIAAVGPLLPLESPTSTDAVASASPQPAAANADQPAVIISLSANASDTLSVSAQAAPKLGTLDPDAVDNALSWTAGANGFAFNAAHYDYAADVTQFGKAIADRNKAAVDGAAINSASFALSYASNLGIPVQNSASPDATKAGAASGTITVGAFSFTSGGSSYAITSGKNGTLIGTKDGQAWKTWERDSSTSPVYVESGATVALQALTALNAQHPPTTKLDVSA